MCFCLGISSILDAEGAGALKFISESFDGLELPEPLLRSSGIDKNLNVVNLTDPVPKSVARGIPYQTTAIKNEFFNHLLAIFAKMRGMGINSLTLDLGIDASSTNDSKRERLILFLKSLAPHLYRHETYLRLPLRIPAQPAGETSPIPSIIRDSMCGMFRMELNVHPHEMLNANPIEHIKDFRFFMDSISFVYEPEAGNFLVDKLLDPWFEALAEINFTGDVVFKPSVSTWESLDDAVDGLHSLMNS